MRWKLPLGLLASAVACGAVDDSAWTESVDNVEQGLTTFQGRTATFRCNPPTGTGIVVRRCNIQFGDGERLDKIPPGNFTHTYASIGTYRYELTEHWCTRSDCAFGSNASRTGSDYVVLTPSGGWRIDLPSRFEGVAANGLALLAQGGPWNGANCCHVDWTFGDGDKDNNDNQSVTHTYPSAGTYTLRATLRDSYEHTLASDTSTITIYTGKANANCSVSNGVVSCTCRSGFRDTGSSCVDYNECAGENGGDNCNSNSRCDNTPGGFSCVACPSGYRANSDGTSCVTIPPDCDSGERQCNGNTSQVCNSQGRWEDHLHCVYACAGGVCQCGPCSRPEGGSSWCESNGQCRRECPYGQLLCGSSSYSWCDSNPFAYMDPDCPWAP